jgi:hypothetical protein
VAISLACIEDSSAPSFPHFANLFGVPCLYLGALSWALSVLSVKFLLALESAIYIHWTQHHDNATSSLVRFENKNIFFHF